MSPNALVQAQSAIDSRSPCGDQVAGLYEYAVPDGFSDIFFAYVFNAFAVGSTTAALNVTIGETFYFTLTAVTPGVGGNAITFATTGVGTPGLTLLVTVVGNAISVRLATDGGGVSTSTRDQIVAALNAVGAVTALVTVTPVGFSALFTGNFGPTNLFGGAGGGGGGVGTGVLLVNGSDNTFLKINVTDGAFVCRAWNGAYTLLDQTTATLGRIQIYGENSDKWFETATKCYTPNPHMQCAAVLPEKHYTVDSAIKFDLLDVAVRNQAGGIPTAQLVFYGVRRINNAIQASDPVPSNYRYYEKTFKIPFSFQIAGPYNTALPLLSQGFQTFISIADYDFELRHITKWVTDANGAAITVPSPFAITLYDSALVARSNLPVMSEFLIDDAVTPTGRNYFPSPPIMYKVDARIVMDIYGLLAPAVAFPVTVNLLFDGVRRVPCV